MFCAFRPFSERQAGGVEGVGKPRRVPGRVFVSVLEGDVVQLNPRRLVGQRQPKIGVDALIAKLHVEHDGRWRLPVAAIFPAMSEFQRAGKEIKLGRRTDDIGDIGKSSQRMKAM